MEDVAEEEPPTVAKLVRIRDAITAALHPPHAGGAVDSDRCARLVRAAEAAVTDAFRQTGRPISDLLRHTSIGLLVNKCRKVPNPQLSEVAAQAVKALRRAHHARCTAPLKPSPQGTKWTCPD